MRQFEPYEVALTKLTNKQIELLHAEGRRAKEYTSLYHIKHNRPARASYTMLLRSRKVDFWPRWQILRFIKEQGYVTGYNLNIRNIEVLYPGPTDKFPRELVMQEIHNYELGIMSGELNELGYEKLEKKRQVGRPPGARNKPKKIMEKH